MFEAHRKDALVDLVELHQLQEVYEERQAVVHGEVLPASLFALQRRGQITVRMHNKRRVFGLFFRFFFERTKGTHRDHQVMFGLQLVAQREDEALGMLLALTNEEHPTHTHAHAHAHTYTYTHTHTSDVIF